MSRLTCFKIALSLLCLLLVVDLSFTQSCGKRKVVNLLIVNGTEAKDGHWPWYAAIFHNKGLTLDYVCGGTILDQNTVLTAAHCVMTPNGKIARRRLIVQVGRHRIRVGSNRAQELEAFELIVHPKYSVNSIEHDIALIMLATDITYTNYIQPICLWNRDEELNSLVGTKGTVIGFGIDESDNVSDTLREATIPVVSHITCIESNWTGFRSQLTSNMFCAGNRDGIGACNGDSGGGLFFNYSNTWYIRGIVSFTKPLEHGNTCDTKEYTVFTDVAKYLKWIEQHMAGTSDKLIVTGIENDPKIRLLPMSTCGPNPYATYDELSKPVLLGYPWMGLVECIDNISYERETLCNAILISDRYLVTGAQCTDKLKHCVGSSVRLGDYDLNKTKDCAEIYGSVVCSPPFEAISIESVITHPGYNSSSKYVDDIALIRLADPADTSQSNVKPICLPVTSELRRQKSTRYTMTSWVFVHSDKSFKPVLNRSLRENFELAECQKMYKNLDINLVQQVRGESRYLLYGILSLDWNCDHDLPLVYTNVASYVDWILENMHE